VELKTGRAPETNLPIGDEAVLVTSTASSPITSLEMDASTVVV
jgi:hypothetical protein